MGHCNNLKHQVYSALKNKLSIGNSRHQGKINGESKDSIYSYRTLHNYQQSCIRFVDFCKKNYGSKSLDDCKNHINDYIQSKRNENLSAHTQKAYLSAIGKMYGESFFDKVETDKRTRANIARGRLDTESLRHFSEKNNSDLVNFCKNTGLRRSELYNLKAEDLVYKDNKYYIHVRNGKGGKERFVEILNQDKKTIDFMKNKAPNEKVFSHIHSKAPVHQYRAEFCNNFYNSICRNINSLSRSEKYFCRNDKAGVVYDRDAMRKVSENLGHVRESVIASNYLN